MRSVLLTLHAIILATACGGIAVIDGGGSAGQGGSAGSAGAGGAGGSAGQGGIGAIGGSAIVIADDMQVKLGANCQPVVGPDPISGEVAVVYENIGGSVGSLEMDYAQVVFATPMEGWVFPIELSPTSSGPVGPGQKVEITHLKVATEGDSSFVCNFCGLQGTLTMSWANGEQQLFQDFDLGCFF